MSKLAWGVLALGLIAVGAFLGFVVGADAVGGALALLGLFAFFPAGIGGFGADTDGGD